MEKNYGIKNFEHMAFEKMTKHANIGGFFGNPDTLGRKNSECWVLVDIKHTSKIKSFNQAGEKRRFNEPAC